MDIVLLDNFDSFTYNLVHYLESEGAAVQVMRNNAIDWEAIERCEGLVLSPGPGLPPAAGELMAVIDAFAPRKKILGVCLGLQALVLHFGGALMHAPTLFHGEETLINQCAEDELYAAVPRQFKAGRYHSWVANPEFLPSTLVVTAVDNAQLIMSVKHIQLPIHAVQFHPESVMTPDGKTMIRNWLNL